MPVQKYVNKSAMAKRRIRKKKQERVATQALKIAKNNRAFINKTIEMKQVNYQQNSTSLSSTGFAGGSFLSIATGAEDGSALGSQARVGNSITLLRQQVCINLVASSTDTFNQVRVIVAESLDGNQPLALTDVLEYGSYALYGAMVFASPYTTKTTTNKRYKIHYDNSFEISALPTKGGSKASKVIKHVVRYGKNGKELEYGGTGALNPNNHRLTLLMISDSVSATHPAFAYSVRSSYKDA